MVNPAQIPAHKNLFFHKNLHLQFSKYFTKEIKLQLN